MSSTFYVLQERKNEIDNHYQLMTYTPLWANSPLHLPFHRVYSMCGVEV